MRISEVMSAIEETAPLSAQESYDNSGLIVGDPSRGVSSALLCVDVTEEVMDEAETLSCGLVISHHPVIFHPLKRLTGSDYVQRIVERAVRSGIALYACHTNLDSVRGGMSFRAADMLGVRNPELLSVSGCGERGFGVIGELENGIDAEDFLAYLRKTFSLKVIRHSDICRRTIRRIAVCTGSGADLIETAAEAGADIYIAADFKYNDFFRADGRLTVADIGHFESEYLAIDLLYDIITKKLPTFAVHKSRKSRNPVNYSI